MFYDIYIYISFNLIVFHKSRKVLLKTQIKKAILSLSEKQKLAVFQSNFYNS